MLRLLAVNFLVFAVSAELASMVLVHLKSWPSARPTYHLTPYRFWTDTNPAFGIWHRPNGHFVHQEGCFSLEYSTNSYGARDVERSLHSSQPRAVVLGDSIIEGFGLADQDRLTNILEKRTGREHLNFGVGGGPLCNNKGELVGITYLNLTDVGRSILAIPSEYFTANRDELLRHGRRISTTPRAWMGLLSYTVRDHVIIAGVMPGGPSDKAGLKQGDVVLAVGGRDINERRAFYDALWSHQPGERVSFKIMRNSQVRTIEIPGIGIEEYFG